MADLHPSDEALHRPEPSPMRGGSPLRAGQASLRMCDNEDGTTPASGVLFPLNGGENPMHQEHGRTRNRLRDALLLLALLFAAPAWSSQVTIDQTTTKLDLRNDTSWFLDAQADQSAASMFERVDGGSFLPLPAHGPTFGFHDGAYWLHSSVLNRSGADQRWLLVLSYALIDSIDLYVRYPDGRIEHFVSGDTLTFAARSVSYRHPNFWIDIANGEDVDILLRAQSRSSIQLPLTIYSPAAFAEMAHNAQLGLGIYYGILFGLLLYNLILWLALRDANHLWYVLHLSGIGLLSACIYGLAFEWLWPQSPWLANQSVPISIALAQLAMHQFARRFLDLRHTWPLGDRIAKAILAIYAALAVASLALPYSTAVLIGTALVFPGVIYILIEGINAARHGFRAARLFLLSWSILLLGAAVYAMVSFGVLPKTLLTEYGIQIGSTLEMFGLSFALAYRYVALRSENERIIHSAKTQLERRVAERTGELQSALEQLADANARLRQLNRHDQLTGAYNRSHVNESYERMLKHVQHDRQQLGLLILDIDHFKAINDNHGHLAGDDCLREVAKRIKSQLNDERSIVARFSGEEFVIMAPCNGWDDAHKLAEHLRQQFAASPIACQGMSMTVSVSIGIHLTDPLMPQTLDRALTWADRALSAAKKAGRNTVARSDAMS
ncbi:MAG: hypothetical protein CVV12_10560 [Gammaproteobacteria bacterium HGW-Gammaproteobacteria-2]|nr:MAG: hypothetical protein CVV12_10560 [Gammaproteobacteria bacterium HGW-Gammaproteobacteria-2]